ncbi:hypothetical protein ACFSQP_11090 [Bizionia sediminis]|uniref:Secreted protein n=1 Tax=Bizionia sediminis TaxID=1737064 RepID=A0ABW5KVL3_9FLAO
MKKAKLYKFLSATMALLVLFSTVSFTVEKHFCGDVLIDAAVFHEPEKCQSDSYLAKAAMDCCTDTVDVVQGQDELSFKSDQDVVFESLVFLATLSNLYVTQVDSTFTQKFSHQQYQSPSLYRNLLVQYQVFLI